MAPRPTRDSRRLHNILDELVIRAEKQMWEASNPIS